MTLILSLLVLAGVGGGVFYLYRGGARGSNEAPQPVGAPIHDVRSAAPVQPQAADPAAGLSIYKDDPNASVPPAFIPPPEQPTARQAAPPPSVPTPLGAPAATGSTQTAAGASPTPPATGTATTKPTTQTAESAPDSVDDIHDASAKTAPKPKAVATAKPATTAGAAIVQIGAFSSEHLADQAWSSAAGVAPGAMAGKGKRVVPMDKDGVTLYRTAITGFASHDAAAALCAKLQAAGKSCFVR